MPDDVAATVAGAMLGATRARTAEHSDDVVLLANAICDRLELTGGGLDDVLAASRLQDIGKTAIPVDVLDKPGPLNEPEWELMREHTVIAEEVLSSVAELRGVAKLVRHSHERWDGSGYPDGLSGDEIPLGSRIIFCADAFEAIRGDRPYRPGRTAPQALDEVKRCAGTQFDPSVVEALEDAVREMGIVGAPSRSPRSRKLLALALVLAVGIGGTALARTGSLPGFGAVGSLGGAAIDQGSAFGDHFGLGFPAGGGGCLNDDCVAPKQSVASATALTAAPLPATGNGSPTPASKPTGLGNGVVRGPNLHGTPPDPGAGDGGTGGGGDGGPRSEDPDPPDDPTDEVDPTDPADPVDDDTAAGEAGGTGPHGKAPDAEAAPGFGPRGWATPDS